MLSVSESEVVFEELFIALEKLGIVPDISLMHLGTIVFKTPKYAFMVDYLPRTDNYSLSVSDKASNGFFRADFPTLSGVTCCISFILNKSI